MPTFYADLVNGNDLNSGDCPFGGAYGNGAPLLAVADGVTNGTTALTSTTGGFTAGMVGRTLMLWSGATFRAYRTVSAFVSTNQVTMNATVTSYTGLTVRVGGALRTITGARAEMLVPGDMVRIAKSPPPYSIGNATWTNLSRAVTLAAAQTTTVELCESAWTAEANVTSTASSTRKEGSLSASLAIAAAFTTGKVAHRSFAALDLSGRQCLSFWIRNNAAIAAGNVLRVCLCSDTTGDAIVDTFFVPAIPSVNRWLPLTIARNGGGNLGASIQSIAVYADVDPGTVTLLLDNFIACSSDGLNLQSLISKNSAEQGGAETWYGIKSIVGTAIQLDADTNSASGEGTGYFGATETVETYRRETVKTSLAASSSATVQEVMASGTLGNLIEYQGGWNTSTNTQDGGTMLDGLSGFGQGIRLSSKSYTMLNWLCGCRYNDSIYYTGSNNNIITTLTAANNNASFGVYYVTSSNNNKILSASTAGNGSGGIYNDGSINYLANALIAEATEVAGFTAFANSRLFSTKHDQTVDNHWIFTDGGTINSQTAVRQSASGIAWRLAPTSTNRQASYPLDLSVAQVACAANKLVTVKAWLRRSNTALTMALVCRGGQLAGVPNNVIATMTAAADTWQEVTITFTPTEAGVVNIEVWAYGGTTHAGFVDDLTITQAT